MVIFLEDGFSVPLITPVLGILMGVVGTLVFLAVIIVLLMRAKHGKRSKETQNCHYTDFKDDTEIPLKREVEDKTPDVVPDEDGKLG